MAFTETELHMINQELKYSKAEKDKEESNQNKQGDQPN